MNDVPSRSETFDLCLEHFLQVVSNATPSHQPFPHFSIHGFFPEHLYRLLLRNLPDRQAYQASDYERQTGDEVRWRLGLNTSSLDSLDDRVQQFWLGIRDALGSVEFKRVVFRTLATGLAFRYSVPEDRVAELPGFPLPALFREVSGYSIKPHPDTRKKVVTMQISLAADESQSELGTQFYRRSLKPSSLTREPWGFDVVKQCPFRPNCASAFVVLNTLTTKSWHGRTTLGPATGVRNSLLTIWHERAEHGEPELLEGCSAPMSAA